MCILMCIPGILTACRCFTNISRHVSSFSPKHVKFTVYFVLLKTTEGVAVGREMTAPDLSPNFHTQTTVISVHSLPALCASSTERPICNS